jgi:hypothetical protein
MTTVQRFAIGLFGTTAAVAAGFFVTAPRVLDARRGRMAQTGGARAAAVLTTVAADRLTGGPIVAIAVHDDAVYLLQNHSWLRVRNDSVAGPFGSGVRGAAGVLASAAGIAVTDSCIYVLDRLARAVLVYEHAGGWARTMPLRHPVFDAFAPAALALDARGRLLLSGYHADPPARWTIVRIEGDRAAAIHTRAASPYGIVLPLAAADGRIYALSADDYRVAALAEDGTITREFARADPPRVPFPASAPKSPAGAPLPPFIPAAAHAFARVGGTFLVAVSASPDEVWIEEIDSAGHPLRTLLEQPVSLPVALSEHAVFTLREDAQQTVIERHLLRQTP